MPYVITKVYNRHVVVMAIFCMFSRVASADPSSVTTQSYSPVALNTGRDVIVTYNISGVDPAALKRLEELLNQKDASLIQKKQEADDLASQYRQVKQSLDDQLGNGPNITQAHALLQEGKFQEASSKLKSLATQQAVGVQVAAATQFDLGGLALLQLQSEEAVTYFETAHRLQPANLDYAEAFAAALFHERQCEKAAEIWREVLSYYESLDPSSRIKQANIAKTLNSLGSAYQCSGQAVAAIGSLIRARDILERQLATQPNSPQKISDLGWSWNALGSLYRDEGNLVKAQSAFKSALDLYKDLPQKTGGGYQTELALTQTNLGQIEDALGNHLAAVTLLETARLTFDSLQKHYGLLYSSRWAWVSIDLGTAYQHLKMNEKAEAAFTEGLNVYQKLADLDTHAYRLDVAWALHSLADYYRSVGRVADAHTKYDEAFAIYQDLPPQTKKKYKNDIDAIKQAVTSLNHLNPQHHHNASARSN